MRKIIKTLLLTVCASMPLLAAIDSRPTLYIIGDSTVKNGKGKGDGNLWGWGSFLDGSFDTTRIAVRNYALGGRSSRTFITEGHWDLILSQLRPGDYVLMQFGHNDGGPLDDTARARGSIKGTGVETKDIYNPILKKPETVHTYGWYMRKYVNDAKAKGAIPIICSPIPRNIFVDGKVERSTDYGAWAKEIAVETGAYFIELNGIIADEYDRLGPDSVKNFFPGDHTHTNEAGARLNVRAVVKGLQQLESIKLKDWILTQPLSEKGRAALPDKSGSSLPGQQEVLASMRLANTWFMNKWPDPGKEIVTNIARPSHIWTRAVYYEGLMALYSIDPRKEYYEYAVDWGTQHHWTPRNGVKGRNADDLCCGQTFIDLFGIGGRRERVDSIKATVDNMVPGDKCDDWHWIDALQMGMPVFTRLGVLYKDTAYFRKMYDLYHYTKIVQGGHGLYNAEEHLWWRDKDFVPPYKEPNGENCYWSRGNGWVLAALVRVLALLPQKELHRPEYLKNYLDMVDALVPLQRADGFWNVSLHDSTHFGGKELTGTALFTYGIAWGIRQGYLDKKIFLPVVARAWNAMVKEALHANGMLGYVQGTGKEPKDGQPVGYDKIPDFEDYGLGCLLLAGSEIYQLSPPRTANLDESKVGAYEEPDLLVAADEAAADYLAAANSGMGDKSRTVADPLATANSLTAANSRKTAGGHRVTTLREWKLSQRPYLYRLFEQNVYGRMPTGAVIMTSAVGAIDSSALGGMAIRKELVLSFAVTRKGALARGAADTPSTLRMVLYLPRKGPSRAPVFVGYNFGGNAGVEASSQWPLKEILARGYGVATAWYWDIEPDRADGWQTGIRTRLSDALGIEPYEWGAIGAWAWGLERMADYLQTDAAVDPHKLIVIGHSRLGKAAVWAGASDSRWAMVVSNESGEGGAALSKRDYGETVAIINAKFPWWFAPAYKQYGSNTSALPLDQSMLLSLIAPRPLYVASAEGDQFSDPRGEFLSAKLAGAA